jgi:hypothetical protein
MPQQTLLRVLIAWCQDIMMLREELAQETG